MNNCFNCRQILLWKPVSKQELSWGFFGGGGVNKLLDHISERAGHNNVYSVQTNIT